MDQEKLEKLIEARVWLKGMFSNAHDMIESVGMTVEPEILAREKTIIQAIDDAAARAGLS